MSKNPTTSKLVNEVIRYGATGGFISTVLVAPGMAKALDKPMQKLYKHLDTRNRELELQRIIYKMKERGYLAGEYEHGLQLTAKAQQRLARVNIDDLRAKPQQTWDRTWRIVVYDIPEKHRRARNALTVLLRQYGCFQLQKSTWITPFPCRADIETFAAHFEVARFITYFEASYLDNDKPLIARFKRKYPATQFP